MSDLLFKRAVRLIVAAPLKKDYKNVSNNAVEIEDMRVQFKVAKTLTKQPNTAEIMVTNLSEKTRAQVQGKGCRVILSAGYATTLAQIFSGDARLISHQQEGPEWVTKIECGDGERAYRHARVNESFKENTPVSSVVRTLVDRLGVDAGNALEKLNAFTGHYTQGYSAFGRAAKELDKVLKAWGFEWSIQDNRLQIFKVGENSREIVVLDADSGLIGSPEMGSPEKRGGPPVLKVRSLLQPGIRPGAQVVLDAAHHKGKYKVLRVEHAGDTAGGDWYTTLDCVAI